MTLRTAKSILSKSIIPADKITLTGSGQDWEIECMNESTSRKIQKLIPGLGGYKTGYGAWVLRQGYHGKGDWNDKSSAWHY